MSLVFKTHPDSTDTVDVVGAGRLFPQGKGGIVVSDAALVLPELQEKDDEGVLKLDDDGNPIPLTGSALTAAAKRYAEDRGFTTVNLSEAKIETLAQEAGVPPDPIPLAEAGRLDYERAFGTGLTTVNDDPEELVDPPLGSGVPVAPTHTDSQED